MLLLFCFLDTNLTKFPASSSESVSFSQNSQCRLHYAWGERKHLLKMVVTSFVIVIFRPRLTTMLLLAWTRREETANTAKNGCKMLLLHVCEKALTLQKIKRGGKEAGLTPHTEEQRRQFTAHPLTWYHIQYCLGFSQGYLFIYMPFLYFRLKSSKRRQYR